MAIVERERKGFTTYYSVVPWQGKQHWKNCGHDRREAERIDRDRKKTVKAGTFNPDAGEASTFTLRQWFESWLTTRENRSKKDEARWIRRHVLTRKRFAEQDISEWDPPLSDALVTVLKTEPRSAKDARPLTHKSISNVIGVLHIMFADAKRAKHVSSNPIDLKPKSLKRDPAKPKEIYSPTDVTLLVRHASIPEDVRVLNALAFYTGMREGEVCGRRWRDLDDGAEPLWCLDVATQYGGAPLKTDRPRVVPVHPELAEILRAWATGGFELLTCRKPTPDDYIVPLVTARAKTPHHTRSTYYKAFIRACEAVKIPPRTLHSTRHTFVSIARRGGALKDWVEKITHNAKGDIIDRYTAAEWGPLCDAVLKFRLDIDAHQRLRLPIGNTGNRRGPALLRHPAVARELPQTTVVETGSIPGASTPFRHELRGFENRVNFGVNALEFSGAALSTLYEPIRQRLAREWAYQGGSRPRRDAEFGEAGS